MNKTQFIEAVAEKSEVDKKTVSTVVAAQEDVIKDTLKSGDKVVFGSLGTFLSRERAARKGRNPQTGKTIDIAASTVPAFKATGGFKKALNGG